MLHDVKDGLKLHCDLNWSKKTDEFGGVNTWGGPPRDVKGRGPKFSLVPQDKPNLGSFVLTVYLSTTGDWKDKTLLATVRVPVGRRGPTKTVTLSGERVSEQRRVSGGPDEPADQHIELPHRGVLQDSAGTEGRSADPEDG